MCSNQFTVNCSLKSACIVYLLYSLILSRKEMKLGRFWQQKFVLFGIIMMNTLVFYKSVVSREEKHCLPSQLLHVSTCKYMYIHTANACKYMYIHTAMVCKYMYIRTANAYKYMYICTANACK